MNFLFVGHDDAGELAGLYEANEGTAQTRAVGLKQVGGGLEAKEVETGPAKRGRAENYVKTRIPGRYRCSNTTNTKRMRNVAVGTTKKSRATRPAT